MIELTAARCPRSPESYLSVMHADAPDEAQSIAAELTALTGMDHLPILDLGASIATQCGPGTLSVGYFTL
jgi:fatty acid-binding protein DegV